MRRKNFLTWYRAQRASVLGGEACRPWRRKSDSRESLIRTHAAAREFRGFTRVKAVDLWLHRRGSLIERRSLPQSQARVGRWRETCAHRTEPCPVIDACVRGFEAALRRVTRAPVRGEIIPRERGGTARIECGGGAKEAAPRCGVTRFGAARRRAMREKKKAAALPQPPGRTKNVGRSLRRAASHRLGCASATCRCRG